MCGMTCALIVLLAAYGMNAQDDKWHVATDGSGIAGTNWATAFTGLQAALDTATNGDTIYVKAISVWGNTKLTVVDSLIAENHA